MQQLGPGSSSPKRLVYSPQQKYAMSPTEWTGQRQTERHLSQSLRALQVPARADGALPLWLSGGNRPSAPPECNQPLMPRGVHNTDGSPALTGGAALSRCAPVPFSFDIMLGRVWIQVPFRQAVVAILLRHAISVARRLEGAIAGNGLVSVVHRCNAAPSNPAIAETTDGNHHMLAGVSSGQDRREDCNCRDHMDLDETRRDSRDY